MTENRPLTVLCIITVVMLLLNCFVFWLGSRSVERGVVILLVLMANCVATGGLGWLGGRHEVSLPASVSLVLLLASWWAIWCRIWFDGPWNSLTLSAVLNHPRVEFIIIYSLVNVICFFFCYTVGEEQVIDED